MSDKNEPVSSLPALPSEWVSKGQQDSNGTIEDASRTLPTADHEPELLRNIGPYLLEAEIGRGGMGVVYRALQPRLNRLVALKIILHADDAEPAERLRFLREAELLARLQHPNIVQVFEIGVHEGKPFLTLEYIHGGSLDRRLRQGPLPPREAAVLVEQIARAMQVAHDAGIIHRDLKPANVLLAVGTSAIGDAKSPSVIPKVTDFGLARVVSESGQTQSGVILGTPSYMPPEQAAGKVRELDVRVDVYSLGAVLYECLTGRPPFRAATPLETVLQVLTEEPVGARQLQPGLSRDLETICLKCLRKDPVQRYTTAEALADDLRRFLADEPIRARPVGNVERLVRWVRRHPAIASLLAFTGFLLAAVAAISSVAAVRLKGERDRVDEARQEAVNSDKMRRHELVQAYMHQARAGRMSRQIGQRFDSLEAIGKAVRLARDLDFPAEQFDKLRNEAIAALTLLDVRPVRARDQVSAGARRFTFDHCYERYAHIDRQGVVTVRRVEDDAELLTWKAFDPDAELNPIMSPDGQYLLIWAPLQGNQLKVWRLNGPKPVAVFPTLVDVSTASFSLDSRQIAVAGVDGSLTRFDLATGQTVHRLQLPFIPSVVAFHPVESRQIAVAHGWTVNLVDLETGKVVGQAMPHSAGINHLAWHPQGDLLAVCANESKIHLWNPETGRKTVVLEGLKNNGLYSIFNRSGDLLVSSGWEGMMRFWHPRSGKVLFSTPGYLESPRFSADDRRIHAWVRDPIRGGVGQWEVAAPREYRTLVHDPVAGTPPDQWVVSIHPNGRWLAVAYSDGCRILDLASGRQLTWLPVGVTHCVRFEPTGALLTSTQNALWRWPVFGGSTGAAVPRIGPPQRLPVWSIGEHISVSLDGGVLAVPSGNDTTVIHADRPYQPVRLGPDHSATSTAVSPDGRYVATSGHHGLGLKIWDAARGELVTHLLKDHQGVGATFSPDGRWLATSGGEMILWTVGTWKRHLSLPQTGVPAFTADGKLMAVSVARSVMALVDPETGREYARLEDPNQNGLGWPVFSPDGTRLVTGSDGENGYAVQVWDLRLIRQRLAELDLDWELPKYPPLPVETSTPLASPRFMEVLGMELVADPAKWKEQERKLTLLRLIVNPFDAEAHYLLSREHDEQWRVKSASDHLRFAVALKPDFSPARYARAVAAARFFNWKEAIEELNFVCEQEPTHPSARYMRGQILQRLNRHAEAVTDYTDFAVRYPQDGSVLKRRADCYDAMGKKAEAEADRMKAVALGVR